LEQLQREEAISISDGVHIRKGGQRINVSFSISPVKDAAGSTVGFSAFIRPNPSNPLNPPQPPHSKDAVRSSSNSGLRSPDKSAPQRYNFGTPHKP
jgi:hypothetical protein